MVSHTLTSGPISRSTNALRDGVALRLAVTYLPPVSESAILRQVNTVIHEFGLSMTITVS